MSDPSIALQAALYDRLSSELSVPVYDSVPMGTGYPYVTIDSEQIKNISPISGRKRAKRYIYLSVWSDYKGRAEVRRISSEIEAALDERPLDLTSHIQLLVEPGEVPFVTADGMEMSMSILPAGQTVGRAVSVRVESMSSRRDADGVTYQGSVTLRVITQQ
ncbi:MAG: DUF3168 domain-containing protein [Thiopseudomonas sp.]|nr:DUF3168 domain-containing protein [Thiopseudomonas sp.]